MNDKKFFKDFIELAPKRSLSYKENKIQASWTEFAGRESVDKARVEIKAETERFWGYLMERQQSDRVMLLEFVTNELMTAYYDVRCAMKELSNKERDKGRPSMNCLYETIVLLIEETKRFMKLKCTDEFINSWAKRTAYLPFFDIEENKPESVELLPNESTKTKTSLQKPALTPESTEILRSYFSSVFKGMGNNPDLFTENLLPDLMKPRTKKQLTAISLLIYKSKRLISTKKPKTFSQWSEIFFSLINISPSTYKPNQLKNDVENLEFEFNYL